MPICLIKFMYSSTEIVPSLTMHQSSKITIRPAPMKTYCLVLLLLILVCSFSGSYGSNGATKALNFISPHFKVRKLGGVDVLDYHDAGPNPSHDPGKGKGGPKASNINP